MIMIMVILITIQFFIIYVLSQQPRGQLQIQHGVDRSSYIMDKHNIKSKTKGKLWRKNMYTKIIKNDKNSNNKFFQ
jgi:hypothetical protein